MTVSAFGPPNPSVAGTTGREGYSGAGARADHDHDRTADAAALAASLLVATPVGAVSAFAGSSAPTGWLLCDGTAVSRATYAALFALIGTTYGVGDGSTTFNVPDLRGRTVVMVDGAAARLSANDTLAASSGAETHTHTEGAHTHTSAAHTHTSAGHTHGVSATHTHTSAAHTHTLGDSAVADINFASASNVLHIRSVAAATWTENRTATLASNGSANSASNTTGAALNGNTDSTTPGSTGSSSPGTTDSATPADTGSTTPGATGSSNGTGTGATSSMQPYLVLNYIIRTGL